MPDAYKVEILPAVIRKDFKKLSSIDVTRVMAKIKLLGTDPRPARSKKLSSREEYRIRQGSYRILYVIDDGIKVVQVTKVKHRKDVYK